MQNKNSSINAYVIKRR